MPIYLTADAALDLGAAKWIDHYEPGIQQGRRGLIIPATKYNLLVKTFNASTVLLVMAAVSAVLFAFSSAVTFGAIGYFLRLTSEKELDKYTLPLEPGQGNQNILNRLINMVSTQEIEANIFTRVGVQRPANWSRHQVFVLDWAVWMNEVPLPG